MSDVPQGWTRVDLGAINEFASLVINPASQPDVIFELYSVPAFPTRQPERLPGAAIGSVKQLVEPDDILICKINPRINRVWRVMPKGEFRQIASSEWIVVRLPVLSPDFLRYYFSTPVFRELICRGVTGVGGSLTRAQPKRVATLPVLIAPLREQHRIVNKIGATLARIEACRDRLDRVLGLLKNLRQSILSAAISGKLTEKWRGKDLSDWTLERADAVCAKVQNGGTPAEGFLDHPNIPFLKVYNIVNQSIDFTSRPQFISTASHDKALKRSQTVPGDVLMNIVGPPLGKVAIVPDTYPEWNINQALTLFRPGPRITSGWLYYLLCKGDNLASILHETRGSAGQINISLSQCRHFRFPVPPVAEQHEIVRRVDALFAYADALEARCVAARAKIERLPAATLDSAFRGHLVPQDPEDEPTGLLLQRMQADKTARFQTTPLPKRTRKPRMTPLSPETVLESIRFLPDGPFTFDELRRQLAVEYDALKEAVFTLLSEKQPALKQVFDPEKQAMTLIRINP
ncbi:restriction endonuclease subunit S [Larkinella humicola]|uniref:Type I restriction endonuclease subunit S n=1 Tax=Larkinella humicola TaxID=2607654 RepID=A0A5N1J8Z4_9BACT|nr:restriction endonuclease subunit S [Larkinella humicola]KAA9346644.1 type I restriction endonuclease subunit S [Larkinella humicola]